MYLTFLTLLLLLNGTFLQSFEWVKLSQSELFDWSPIIPDGVVQNNRHLYGVKGFTDAHKNKIGFFWQHLLKRNNNITVIIIGDSITEYRLGRLLDDTNRFIDSLPKLGINCSDFSDSLSSDTDYLDAVKIKLKDQHQRDHHIGDVVQDRNQRVLVLKSKFGSHPHPGYFSS